MVTSSILPQLRQDAHLHLDEAIVTTTLLPLTFLTCFHTDMRKGVAMTTISPR